MSAALTFALRHWQKVGAGLLLVLAIGGIRGCMSERDARIRGEAIREQVMADFRIADQAYYKVATESQETLARLERERLALASKLDSAEAETEALRTAVRQASQDAIETGQTLGQTLRALEDSTALQQWREHLAADQRQRRAHADETEAIEQERDLWKTAAERANEWGSAQYNQRVAAEAALDEARDAIEARVRDEGEPWYEHWAVDVAKVGAAAYVGYEVGRRW